MNDSQKKNPRDARAPHARRLLMRLAAFAAVAGLSVTGCVQHSSPGDALALFQLKRQCLAAAESWIKQNSSVGSANYGDVVHAENWVAHYNRRRDQCYVWMWTSGDKVPAVEVFNVLEPGTSNGFARYYSLGLIGKALSEKQKAVTDLMDGDPGRIDGEYEP